MIDENDWFSHAYDEVVGSEVDGIGRDKLRDELAHGYLNAVERGEVRLPSEMDMARAKADQYLRPIRKGRTESFRRDIQNLLEALHDETILGVDDPRLQQAVPVGDGKDKRLSYWTVQDWMTAVKVRQRNVQRAAEAATDFTEIAEAMVGEMARRNVRTTGDMYRQAVS